MKVISLFSGCGGLDLGFKEAGFDLIWANDIDPDSCDTHSTYFGNECKLGNIDELLEKIPKGDVLIGGPPCQSFSLVGKRYSDDPRGQLIKSFIAAVSIVEPKIIVMENVPGMASSKVNNVRLPRLICEEFGAMGYETFALKLRAVDYFVPQRRERLVVIGFKNLPKSFSFRMLSADEFGKLIFGVSNRHTPITAYQALEDLGNTVGAIADKNWNNTTNYSMIAHSEYAEYMRKNVGETTSLHFSLTMSDRDREFVQHIRPGGNYQDIPDSISTKRILNFKKTGGRTTTYARLHPDQPSYTINTYFNRPNVGSNYHYKFLRLISPREALRLQSFPDDFVPSFNSQRSLFRQIGNAVPPLLSRAIAESIKLVL